MMLQQLDDATTAWWCPASESISELIMTETASL